MVPEVKAEVWVVAEGPQAAVEEWESQAGIPGEGTGLILKEEAPEPREGSCWLGVRA